MKVVFAILGIVLLLGVGYGLAFFGIIPVRSMAAKNPKLKSVLIAMKLDTPAKKPPTTAKVSAVPLPDPLAGDKAELAAERAQIAQERAAMQKRAALAAAPHRDPNGVIPTSPKVAAIYDTMKPAELAALFEKMSDAQVCDALLKMDEQKAGKVLVAMPPARAALITTRMNATATPATAPQQPQPMVPAKSVP